jgi:ribosomal-protein-alanine N-acetyltransferase
VNNLFKVLKNENDIIGYYIALFAEDECQLLNITVRLELQKKGFGQLMLKNLFTDCRKKNIINVFLEVRKSNNAAIRLYEKNGFNEIGVRNNYYKNKEGKEDAILMGLSI